MYSVTICWQIANVSFSNNTLHRLKCCEVCVKVDIKLWYCDKYFLGIQWTSEERQGTLMHSRYYLGSNHLIKPLLFVLAMYIVCTREHNIHVSFQINCCFRLRSKGCCFGCVWLMACLARVLFLQKLIILCIKLLWTSKWCCWCREWARTRPVDWAHIAYSSIYSAV